jgi:hypothetical protein
MVFRGETLSQKDALDCALPLLNGAGANLPVIPSGAAKPEWPFPQKPFR